MNKKIVIFDVVSAIFMLILLFLIPMCGYSYSITHDLGYLIVIIMGIGMLITQGYLVILFNKGVLNEKN